ncbi:SAM-dependent methyltransferase [Porphyromonas catoniae]|uniref:SAM-dependent methyltransferase n=1 Tax=Porphyromonas catoniae TaxID=41976 RepID=UPI0028D037E2|nr:SAM-dependent methyltransferase [Porphyromonas catoniae]
MAQTLGTLYLIPVPLAEVDHSTCLPTYNASLIPTIHHFIVENIRSARRFLKAVDRTLDIDQLTFYELNKHTAPEAIADYLLPALNGQPVGIISEAGCPAVADPGADVVALAQRKGITVIPLVGPSSILMALMGSGFNGQRFAFRGYLPIDERERTEALREMEGRIRSCGETQIFIETPYRNVQLVEQLIRHCSGNTMLCIASALTSPEAVLQTKSLSAWRGNIPNIHKIPTIFLLGR